MEQAITISSKTTEQELKHSEYATTREIILDIFWSEIFPELQKTWNSLYDDQFDHSTVIKSKLSEHWEDILSKMQTDYGVSAISTATFLLPLKIVNVDTSARTLTLHTPNGRGFAQVLQKKYKQLLQSSIRDVINFPCEILFTF